MKAANASLTSALIMPEHPVTMASLPTIGVAMAIKHILRSCHQYCAQDDQQIDHS